ncbi:MAG: hypothetical protein ACYC6N_31125 [Pirellulaceae bacterium]
MRCDRLLLVQRGVGLAVLCCLSFAGVSAAEEATAGSQLALDEHLLRRIPVREVTVFKDGHAFVLHEGDVPVDERRTVYLDQLPTPVIGTFWPYVASDRITLQNVMAGRRTVQSSESAVTIQDLLRANVGAKVHLKLAQDQFAGTIVSIPTRSQEEEDAPRMATGEPARPVIGNVIVVQTAEGYRVMALDAIQEVTFLEPPCGAVAGRKKQDVLSLRLRWNDDQPEQSARVGMVYLQKGIRWIPSYKLDLDGQGRARVKLQATLVNEMLDLDDVTFNLVIGVPHFTFKETIDPMALGQTVAELSTHFQQGSQTAYAFSNAMMTQVARMGEHRGVTPAGGESETGTDQEFADGNQREDLYVFTVPGVSLKKGERMVVPVVEFELPYEDVFTVSLPISPPAELHQTLNTDQQREMARLLQAPKAIHQARFTNESKYPLTTAPALLMREGQLVGQAMMTYAPVGGQVDVELTAAVSIAVAKQDLETGRTPNAAIWSGNSFDRIDLEGKIDLTNRTNRTVKLEVVRHVLGFIDSAGHEAETSQHHVRGDDTHSLVHYPAWWSWYSWPHGWLHVNGMGQVRWRFELPAGQELSLPYKWHYFGR